MPHTPLRALTALALGAALLTSGCTNNEESVQRADEFGRWLGGQAQVASVQKSIKRNSGIPPLLGSVRLEADATAKEPFGDAEIAALGDAIEAYGKEKGYFTSYRTRVTSPGLTVDLTERPDVNDRVVRAAGILRGVGDGGTGEVEWTERQPVKASASLTDAEAVLAAYTRVAGTLQQPEDTDLVVTLADAYDNPDQLTITVAPGRPLPKSLLDGYAALPADPRPQRVTLSAVPRTAAGVDVDEPGQLLPTRTAFIKGMGDTGGVDLVVAVRGGPDAMTVSGTGDVTRALEVVDAVKDVDSINGSAGGTSQVSVGSASDGQWVDLRVSDRQQLDDVVQDVPVSGLARFSINCNGTRCMSITASPDQLERTHRLAAAAIDAGASSFSMRDVRADNPQPVFRMNLGAGAVSDYTAVLDAMRSVGWDGERTVILEGNEGRPKLRFTATSTGRATNVGPASGEGGGRMSDETRQIIDHWDRGATT